MPIQKELVWIHAWWSRKDMAGNIGAEKVKRWWRYLVHRFGAKDYPQSFCLADPGNEYVVYLRYGGTTKIELTGSETSNYESLWYNPSSGNYTEKMTVKGTGIVEFSSPGRYPESPDYHDWVLYIKARL